MSMAAWSSGKRSTRAFGTATTGRSATRAQGAPSVSYSNGSGMGAPSYQPASTRTCVPSEVVASATMASFASKASARLRTRERRNSSPISPAVPSASARSRSRPRGPTRVGVVSAGEGKDAIDRS